MRKVIAPVIDRRLPIECARLPGRQCREPPERAPMVLHIVTVGRSLMTKGFVLPEVMSPIPAMDAWQEAEREVELHSEFGSAAEVLCSVAESVEADLIVRRWSDQSLTAAL